MRDASKEDKVLLIMYDFGGNAVTKKESGDKLLIL